MLFQYSCFISYRRGQHNLIQRFIQELVRALQSHLEPYFDQEVFVDESGLQGGDFFDESLGQALCRSVCMILVFTPKYFSRRHTFCAREYMAMKRLEEKRLRAIGPVDDHRHGFIIPIVFRGAEYLPEEIKERRQFYDFSPYTLVQPEIAENENYVADIEEIAHRIYALYSKCMTSLEDPVSECKEFTLPPEGEIQDWLMSITQPQSPFPLRRF